MTVIFRLGSTRPPHDHPPHPLPRPPHPLPFSPGDRVPARALLTGDRLDTAGLERGDALSVTPLSFRAGTNGVVTLFRYGVVVLVGLSPIEEDEVLRGLAPRISGEFK